MAQRDFVPSKDSNLSLFAQNMSGLITATPTAYGLVAGDATVLANFVALFVAALAASTNPSTRGPSTNTTKNTTRAAMIADIRALARRIQANGNVSATQKINLGLTVPDKVRTPVLPPVTKPVLSITNLDSQSIAIRLADEATPTKRAKPAGVDAAQIYTFTVAPGGTVPAGIAGWTFKGLAKKADFVIPFDASDIGKVAHMRAVWISTRGAQGPVSDEITGSVAA